MSSSKFLIRYKLHHVLFWGIVFTIWYILRASDYRSPQIAFLVTLIKVAELALMIYITNDVLIPRLLYKKKYFLFLTVFVVMIFTSSIVKMNILGRLIHNQALINWTADLRGSLYNNILPHFFLVIAGVAIKLLYDYGKLQQRMLEAVKEKAEAELNFLKSQINPHFLFNSLNSVYFLIHKENAAAREALHKFSEMLRYQLYEVNDTRIPIEKEIHYLKDYMDLQQLRKDEKYNVQFHSAPDVKDFSVEPLLLIPFVENAFKHISHHPHGNNFVKVDLLRVNQHFVFSVINSREDLQQTEKKGGIGLVNVKRRLELLYPGKHELKIDRQNDVYSVQLNLHL